VVRQIAQPGLRRSWQTKLAIGVAVALLAALLPVMRSDLAEAATASFASSMINEANGNCTDVPNSSATNGTQLIQWSCNSGANQSFTFNPVSGTADAYSIGTIAAGSCVDVEGAGDGDNARVIQWTCNNQNNQQFRLRVVSGSGESRAFNVISVASGKCLAPSGDASASNTTLVQLPCGSTASRAWRLPGYTDGGSDPTPTPTGGGGAVWNPPAKYVGPLASTWKHQEDTYANLYGFKNYLFDQVMAAKGSINYCVRWDSNASVSAALRDQVQASLSRQFQKWIDQLNDGGQGWNRWPYKQVPVKVVGWAVRDRSQLQWSDSSVDVYVNNIRENAPQCGEPCGRFFHQDGNYSGCPGGVSHHYDMSLWLTAGMNGGAGGDWGQRIGQEYFVGQIGAENIHILLHEMGHSWGLNDFYDFDPLPGEGFVMKAGSAGQITEFDKWMLRDFWRHLKNRYGL
jgi:hypothetical protein